MSASSEPLEDVLEYWFADRGLLDRALTHRSWISEQSTSRRSQGDNEQLEFLGDSLLGFVVSEKLYSAHPELKEGQLSQLKAQIVCASHLHACASRMGIGEHLQLGRGEERNGGRERRSFLADTLEAIIAAIYLDGGLEAAKNFIERQIIPPAESSPENALVAFLDHKGSLQEQAQSRGLPAPRYIVVGTSGPDHCKIFRVEARIGDLFTATAEGTSKKMASQLAAQALMNELSLNGWANPSQGTDLAAIESHEVPDVVQPVR